MKQTIKPSIKPIKTPIKTLQWSLNNINAAHLFPRAACL
jgi:hypothetical protein